VIVKEIRAALSKVSDNFRAGPPRLRVVSITGTNGKTTTTYLLESVIKEPGSTGRHQDRKLPLRRGLSGPSHNAAVPDLTGS
jgi:UDP-N-acetylmuramyl pentapeptide synthase